MTKVEIRHMCTRYYIPNYTINDDLTVDVDGSVDLMDKGFTELPFSFGKVTGSFDCSENRLTTLKGSPHTVGKVFDCGVNELTSLIGGPSKVGGRYDCSVNKLTSLEGCSTEVGTRLYCVDNQITNLDYLPDSLGRIFCCDENPIGSIFDRVDMEFLEAFKIYKVIKGNEVNLKRLKYVMSVFDKNIDLEEIKKHYNVV